jgi:hypothetical protein
MNFKYHAASRLVTAITTAWLFAACGSNPSTPTTPAPTSPPPASTAAFTVTFSENPVPFRSTGCNASAPQGWFTSARIQETAGVTFTPSALTQKLDGSVSALLTESFNSRFGACAGGSFSPGMIPGNGAVCGSVGVCTTGTFSTYQFQITGTDANGHAVTFDSPVLQLGAR